MARFDAERQLILLSAGVAARRHAMRRSAQHLMGDIEWRVLEQTLRSRNLLPTLGPQIVELAEGATSPKFNCAVTEAITATRRHGAFLQLVAARLSEALVDAGIPSSILKGPQLAEAIFGDPGRRLSSDIDLLVAPHHLRTAVDVVQSSGYDPPVGYVQKCGLPRLHFALLHGRRELPPVELHWRVHWYEQSFAQERLLPPRHAVSRDWRPTPADELVALLLFYARDGFVDLRLAADLSAWWDVCGDDLAPDALETVLLAYPSLSRAVSTAARVAHNVVGLPATHTVDCMPTPGLRNRVAARLANPNPQASESQLYADMGFIDGLLAPRGGFRAFLRRQVLPPREVLDEHARHAGHRTRSLPIRFTSILARYGLTMTRLARAPEGMR
jgi:Uncharacterised nucleotidyltransferase